MRHFLMIAASAAMLSGCMTVAKGTAKAVTLPVKGAYHGTKMVGKGVVGTTKFAGKTVYGTGKLAGKTVYGAGKGIYYVGTVPVKITDKALDTTAQVLSITTQAVDLTGKVVTTTRTIQSARLDAELSALRTAKNILSVTVDALD